MTWPSSYKLSHVSVHKLQTCAVVTLFAYIITPGALKYSFFLLSSLSIFLPPFLLIRATVQDVKVRVSNSRFFRLHNPGVGTAGLSLHCFPRHHSLFTIGDMIGMAQERLGSHNLVPLSVARPKTCTAHFRRIKNHYNLDFCRLRIPLVFPSCCFPVSAACFLLQILKCWLEYVRRGREGMRAGKKYYGTDRDRVMIQEEGTA